MANFTPTQGRYLAFIRAYTDLHGYPPAESEIAAAMCVSPPSVNQMVKMLEKKGLIQRQPGQPRSVQVLVPDDEIPAWNKRKPAGSPALPRKPTSRLEVPTAAPPANLYVVSVYLQSGPTSEKFANKVSSRVLEIRGDQTLEQLHYAIFKAYDRWDEHQYEFQFGKRPFDPDGPNLWCSGFAAKGERGSRRTHDKAGRLGSEAAACLRLLVRLRRRLVSSGSGGEDRASHSDRYLSARPQAGRQISAAVLRRIAAAKGENDVELLGVVKCKRGVKNLLSSAKI
jgi:hypothetical protein